MQIGLESLNLVEQKPIRGTRISRRGIVVRQRRNVTITLTLAVVFRLHHVDRHSYRTTMERLRALAPRDGCIHFIHVGEQYLLFFLQMLLKCFQRAFEKPRNFVQLGMIFSMNLLNLVHQRKHLRAVATNAAMMDLQDVIYQQIRRPLLKIGGRSRLRMQAIKCGSHTLRIGIGLADRLQIVVSAVTTEIDSKMMKHVSRSIVISHDFAYRSRSILGNVLFHC